MRDVELCTEESYRPCRHDPRPGPLRPGHTGVASIILMGNQGGCMDDHLSGTWRWSEQRERESVTWVANA